MSPDTDAYWVGALAMTCARAQFLIATGSPEVARRELDVVLQRLYESPVMDDGFQHELARFWEPRETEIA